MKNIVTLLMLSMAISLTAQDIKRGFKNLEKKDYARAKDDFAKNLAGNAENVGANFGMALVLADDQSPLFDIVDSWQYVAKIQDKLNTLTQEDIEIIGEYFMNTEVRRTSRPVKQKMEIAMEAIEARLIKYIREENDLVAVYGVLEKYPDYRHYDNVVHIRNQFEFRKYEKLNTLETYLEFLQKFPDAAQKEKAERYIAKLAFENVKTKNTVSAYNTYINTYPRSEYVQTALKLRNGAAYNETRGINTLEAYEKFIENYPDALEVAEAKIQQRNLLYEKAKRIKSLQAFNQFIELYPDGQYFVDIFNLKSSELGGRFLAAKNFDSPSIVWAKGFDNNGRIEEGGCSALTTDGGIVVACNTRDADTAFADAWIIKLDRDGKMLWNKIIGQPFEDSVKSVLLDSKGNIYILGYTHLTADRNSKMGWMFKLGDDGTKIWNKTLGNIDIASCATDHLDRIIIGSSTAADTLGNRYSITIFNEDARMIAERSYTGRGCINDLLVTGQNEVLLCGSNWISLIDQRRYMLWDDDLPVELTATNVAGGNNSGYYITGTNKGTIFYSRYNSTGKLEWLQKYDKTDSTQFITDIAGISQGNMLVLESKSEGAKIKTFAPDGKVVTVKELTGNTKVAGIIARNQDTLLLLNDGDLIVVRFTNLVSL
jgi:hypothetical protein